MRNNLFLKRLLIYTQEGKVAFDEKFHKGVNIIRGKNGSGKSTITHFIFFILGGAFNNWVPEAKKCAVVFGEVEMNGVIFTLKRELVFTKDRDGNERFNDKVALQFFWGKLDESLNPPRDKYWQKFEFNTNQNAKSFSNVLFENLNLPIVKGDNNITFHQILRLLYIDQESPTSSLFLYEQFDSQITRETVADLLLGVYNQELYDKKKRLVTAEKEFEDIRREIKATKQFFVDPLTLNPSHVKSIIENKQKEIAELEEKIISLRNENKEEQYEESSKLEFQKLNEKAIAQREIINDLEHKIHDLIYEIEDSKLFVESLNKKIRALNNSIQTRQFLGKFTLEYCPECLTKLKPQENHNTCKLCKENIDESYGEVLARKMMQEISFQLLESQNLLTIDERELLDLTSKFESEQIKLYQIQHNVNSAMRNVRSYNSETIDNLLVDMGYVEGEIMQFRTLLENSEKYEKLLAKENELKVEIESLNYFVIRSEQKQEKLKIEINMAVKNEGVYLLNNDLLRQDEFKAAKEFYIDFKNNITFLSNKYSKYSASSNFYLKVAARFAIFLASLSIDNMRFPRFIFADNMEDKGIEIERAQNLQKILIDRVSEYDKNSYQIIYTTSYITKELDESDYCVGEKYTEQNKTLKNV
jgi:hypothetical protein